MRLILIGPVVRHFKSFLEATLSHCRPVRPEVGTFYRASSSSVRHRDSRGRNDLRLFQELSADDRQSRIEERLDKQGTILEKMAKALEKQNRFWDRVSPDGENLNVTQTAGTS